MANEIVISQVSPAESNNTISITSSATSDTIKTSDRAIGNSPNLNIKSGDSATGNSGRIDILTGSTASSSGRIRLRTADATGASSGQINLITGSSDTGTSGPITVQTGPSTDGNSEDITLSTGVSVNANTGNLNFSTGESSAADSGYFQFTPGNAVGNRGLMILNECHLGYQQGTAPTTTTNANAGTGASSSVSNATDSAGFLSLTIGVTPTTGEQVKVNFNSPYRTAPVVIIFPQNTVSGLKSVLAGVYTTSTTTYFSVNFAGAGAVVTDNFLWNYIVIEPAP